MDLYNAIIVTIWLTMLYAVWAATAAGDPGYGQAAYNIVSHIVTIIALYRSMIIRDLDFTFHGNCFYRTGESTESTTYTSII
jgi:hypothetical protein